MQTVSLQTALQRADELLVAETGQNISGQTIAIGGHTEGLANWL